ncbi:glycosyltransferase [Flexivirga meconopsidis]|uniref:glycosyltransferase n=1 Tax=Flexivirga meconopsidis TaxID=2977121 RepID=UPI00223EE16F
MALISVVIPVFNPGSRLREALDSVLAQTVADFECVVVDDGSREDVSWVAAVPDQRIRLIQQPNRGVSVARNVAVAQSSGVLIAFLDQDDLWHADKLRRQVEVLRDDRSAPYACTGFNWVLPDRVVAAPADPISYHGLLRDQHVCLSSVIVRRSAYLAVGGHDPLLRLMQDYDLFLRLGRLADPVSVPDVLVDYRVHDANASRRYRVAHRERTRILQAHLDAARDTKDAGTIAAGRAGIRRTDELYAHQALDAARAARASGDYAAAAAHLRSALRLDRRVAYAAIRHRLRSG